MSKNTHTFIRLKVIDERTTRRGNFSFSLFDFLITKSRACARWLRQPLRQPPRNDGPSPLDDEPLRPPSEATADSCRDGARAGPGVEAADNPLARPETRVNAIDKGPSALVHIASAFAWTWPEGACWIPLRRAEELVGAAISRPNSAAEAATTTSQKSAARETTATICRESSRMKSDDCATTTKIYLQRHLYQSAHDKKRDMKLTTSYELGDGGCCCRGSDRRGRR